MRVDYREVYDALHFQFLSKTEDSYQHKFFEIQNDILLQCQKNQLFTNYTHRNSSYKHQEDQNILQSETQE
jgi:hypothetical protein